MQVFLDARPSSDAEDASEFLEVRWDFEGDGAWDTVWSTIQTSGHTYPSGGEVLIRLEVRDSDDLTDQKEEAVWIPSDVEFFVHSWGHDLDGQVTLTPEDPFFIQAAGGGGHSLALRSGGSIVAWGLDSFGQVSDTPTGAGFLLLAAGLEHSLALHEDGSLASWGRDYLGLVTDTPAGTDFESAAAGERYSLALLSDGSIVTWGDDSDGQVSQAPAETGFTALAGGGSHGGPMAAHRWSGYGHRQCGYFRSS